MFDAGLVATDKEVEHVDVVDSSVAVVELDGDVAGWCCHVEVQEVAVTGHKRPVGVGNGDWCAGLDDFWPDAHGVRLAVFSF